MFGKLFKRKAATVAIEYKKIENRNLMEAIVYGALLVSAADGQIEDAEVRKLDELIRANENLAHFGPEITTTINNATAKFKANFQVGRVEALRQIGEVKTDPADAVDVFVNALAIAESDGEIEPAEAKVLVELANVLGVRATDYGLEI